MACHCSLLFLLFARVKDIVQDFKTKIIANRSCTHVNRVVYIIIYYCTSKSTNHFIETLYTAVQIIYRHWPYKTMPFLVSRIYPFLIVPM